MVDEIMGKTIIVCLLLILLISACSSQEKLDKEIMGEIEEVEETTSISPPNRNVDGLNKDKNFELPNRNFELDELKAFLISHELTKKSSFHTVDINQKGESLLMSSSKTWGVHLIEDESINNMDAFLDFVKNPNWEIWKYYDGSNDVLYKRLSRYQFKELFGDENKLENSAFKINTNNGDVEFEYFLYNYNYDGYLKKYDYDDYLKDSTLVDYDVFEVPTKFTRGSIPEYRMTKTTIDKNDIWKDNWKEPLLIYKIPCSKDVIIYFRPSDSGYTKFSAAGMKKSDALTNWKSIIDKQISNSSKSINSVIYFF